MNKIDYQALREAAEKATCGAWSLEYGEERFDAGDALIHREVVGYLPICRIEGAHPESGFDEDFQMEQQANAEFIAAANPATVLALLDELEAAEKRIAELESLTVPQLPQQAVPDEMPEPDTARMFFTDAVVAIAKVQGWNACRAAMLHSAEPVSQAYKLNALDGNSPVTPDGWVMVPKELTPEMMRAVQIRSELGGYATSNLSGAYNMFSEFWNVAVSAAPKVDDL
ncbi:ead/Ea22-like family protein [Escherichia marmotae]|uniref:ead/Ea22-like family protein n=1 Tax=Escherichia TaxID=561 RepID=UPI000B7CF826|nr:MULTISPECIES: ead/Ea22-like family protein [Escherichia]EEV8084528.1 ead/Ea22-like family protein [Escherichia coli]EFH7280377.1 ead/Ea22-like family protein [Escherichia coli]EFJ3046747.1 ead/Ea22-like family protein [Escherichia coli]EJC0746382.1 ead/Ea22-like family protein [Escherichia coli]MBY7469886.1 ead/Ea22-like family protein [Escherichia marmotae]